MEAADADQNWSQRVITFSQKPRDIEEETVGVGDEYEVQGRFQGSIGSVMGKVLKAQSIEMRFADFKCLGSSYTNTPDVILKGNRQLKVPWVREHELRTAYREENWLRALLAQPIKYVQDLNCMYGFLSTYEETIFLRQQHVNGQWEVDYSPVMEGSASYVRSNGFVEFTNCVG